ncbi:hypothetical protein DN540_30760, partial [Burkholderia multivorans]
AVWMHKGEILMNGPAESVAERYRWWARNVAKGKEDVADKLLADVMSSARQEEINILEPELVRNPIPRHATRSGKTKGIAPRHVKRREDERTIEEEPEPQLAAAEAHAWPEEITAPTSTATFPVLPKPAAEAVGSQHWNVEPPPLRLHPGDKRVILRAADPNDRASSVAAAGDLTGQRLASKVRLIADQRYADRMRKRRASGEAPHAPETDPDDSSDPRRRSHTTEDARP